MLIFGILLVTVFLIIHYVVVGRQRGIMNVDGIFVLSSWVMAVGTLWVLRDPDYTTPGYGPVVVVPMCIYVLTSVVLFLSRRENLEAQEAVPVQVTSVTRTRSLLALFILALVITVAYYQSVGYNVLALGVKGMLSGVSEDYTTLRIESYSSNRYLFPGYVNQFKNIILPTLSLIWIHELIENRRPNARLLSAGLVGICIFALLGTGQRGAFILFALSIMVFLYRLSPAGFRTQAPRLLGLIVPLVLLVTFLLGRSSTAMDSAQSPLGKVIVLVQEMGKRFMYDNQWSGVMAFRFVSDHPTQWGKEWATGLLGILPSNPGSSLARDVFEYLYGTNRGTAPISMWGSVYYNFGWFGLIVVPVILAILWGAIANRQIASRAANALEAAAGAGVASVAGMWAVGGPEYLLNAGAVAYAILWWWGRRLRLNGGSLLGRRTR